MKMGIARGLRKRIAGVALACVIVLSGLGACGQLVEVARKIAEDMPTAENTFTSLIDINRAMEEAMERGETEFTFNAAGVGEEELQNIGGKLSTFWGKRARYSVNAEFKDVEGILPNEEVDVRSITSQLELSNNYYIYQFVRNGEPIPEDRERAKAAADALPAIADEIFANAGATEYEMTLAAHDWLVANLEYDETTPEAGDENGTYGAIVLKRTMCQGYAEAFELLLRCYTDVETAQILGEALNSGAEMSEWRGHAWNAVMLNGAWYQVDPTFDDPKGNSAGQLSHCYFGQTDEFMRQNHRWDAEYFPVSEAGDFLYFRESGLFAEDWEGFEAIVTELLANEDETPASFEIAARGVQIDAENIQFMYLTRRDLDEIRLSETAYGDIYVQSLELSYTE